MHMIVLLLTKWVLRQEHSEQLKTDLEKGYSRSEITLDQDSTKQWKSMTVVSSKAKRMVRNRSLHSNLSQISTASSQEIK